MGTAHFRKRDRPLTCWSVNQMLFIYFLWKWFFFQKSERISVWEQFCFLSCLKWENTRSSFHIGFCILLKTKTNKQLTKQKTSMTKKKKTTLLCMIPNLTPIYGNWKLAINCNGTQGKLHSWWVSKEHWFLAYSQSLEVNSGVTCHLYVYT